MACEIGISQRVDSKCLAFLRVSSRVTLVFEEQDAARTQDSEAVLKFDLASFGGFTVLDLDGAFKDDSLVFVKLALVQECHAVGHPVSAWWFVFG